MIYHFFGMFISVFTMIKKLLFDLYIIFFEYLQYFFTINVIFFYYDKKVVSFFVTTKKLYLICVSFFWYPLNA